MNGRLKEIALFLASPFFALYYAATLPMHVPGMLIKLFKEGDPENEL
jgi:hypothetical protein